jgi:SHS2 domain-containing protein
MEKKYSILEHPADLGIEAQGNTLAEAFEQAALGLLSVLMDSAAIDLVEERTIELHAADPEQLLVQWLGEILFLFDGNKFASGSFAVEEVDTQHLKAKVKGESLNESKHSTRTDVKAITYHQILVRENQAGSLVRVFLDI